MQIKNRFSGEVILKLDLETLKGANLRGADLRGADLRGANLQNANLWGASLWGASLWGASLEGASLGGADLRGANLRGANLWGANLWGANLEDANLWGANLRGANLRGAKGYSESHEIFLEIVRCERPSAFKKSEWEIIGYLAIHKPCWSTIVKRFAKTPMTRIFKILADKGFKEYLVKYKEELKLCK
jgi:hypothetical protein